MFSGIKMEEFMESEHSGIFRVELVTKNVVLGSSGTHFMHMRVKPCNNQIWLDISRPACTDLTLHI